MIIGLGQRATVRLKEVDPIAGGIAFDALNIDGEKIPNIQKKRSLRSIRRKVNRNKSGSLKRRRKPKGLKAKMSFKDFIKNEFPSFNGEVNFKEDVLIKDKNQSEFTLSLPIYLNKIITKERIKTGKENLKAWETQLAKIHKVWGVRPKL